MNDLHEELSVRFVREKIFHCGRTEMERRLASGLAFIMRDGRIRITRRAISEYQRGVALNLQPSCPTLTSEQYDAHFDHLLAIAMGNAPRTSPGASPR